MHLRHAVTGDALAISDLVQAGFIQHIAPDWEPSAQEDFLAENQADKLSLKISEAALCLVYEHGSRLLGVVFLPRPTLVQLFFVAPGHLRNGIGRALWNAVRTHLEERHPEVKTVELNSSPYALAAYKALGFFPISKPFRRRGAVATRMACWLPGKALELGALGSAYALSDAFARSGPALAHRHLPSVSVSPTPPIPGYAFGGQFATLG